MYLFQISVTSIGVIDRPRRLCYLIVVYAPLQCPCWRSCKDLSASIILMCCLVAAAIKQTEFGMRDDLVDDAACMHSQIVMLCT